MNTRRGFVAISAAVVTATTNASMALAATPTFLTKDEAALIEIITGQIIPKDDEPGAIEAGVVHYIDQQLAGPLNRFAPLYRAGLKSFEPMRTMTGGQQTDFLKTVEKGAQGPDAARLFNVMIDHTMQGFYGSPIHGGNHDEVSWKMLGIDQVMGGHSH